MLQKKWQMMIKFILYTLIVQLYNNNHHWVVIIKMKNINIRAGPYEAPAIKVMILNCVRYSIL